MPDSTELKKEALSSIVGWCVAAIFGTAAALLKWAFPDAWEQICSTILALISPRQLLTLLLISLSVNLTGIAFKLASLKSQQSLRKRFGVLWDSEKNPYCPICNSHLATHNQFGHMENEYFCKPCNNLVYLTDSSGKQITRVYALKNL
jgi:hypothetical protein